MCKAMAERGAKPIRVDGILPQHSHGLWAEPAHDESVMGGACSQSGPAAGSHGWKLVKELTETEQGCLHGDLVE